jgi:hypothetical protein
MKRPLQLPYTDYVLLLPMLLCHCCLQECNLAGKPVYVTRVVDTMTDAPRPTRAEATGGCMAGLWCPGGCAAPLCKNRNRSMNAGYTAHVPVLDD